MSANFCASFVHHIQHAEGKKIPRPLVKFNFLLHLLRRSWLHENVSYYKSANPSDADWALMEQPTGIGIKNLGIKEQTTRSGKEKDARSHV